MLKQVQVVNFLSEDGKIKVYVDTDTSLGQIHDFLMMLKGNIVDRMIKAQKEEQEHAESQKQMSEKGDG